MMRGLKGSRRRISTISRPKKKSCRWKLTEIIGAKQMAVEERAIREDVVAQALKALSHAKEHEKIAGEARDRAIQEPLLQASFFQTQSDGAAEQGDAAAHVFQGLETAKAGSVRFTEESFQKIERLTEELRVFGRGFLCLQDRSFLNMVSILILNHPRIERTPVSSNISSSVQSLYLSKVASSKYGMLPKIKRGMIFNFGHSSMNQGIWPTRHMYEYFQ